MYILSYITYKLHRRQTSRTFMTYVSSGQKETYVSLCVAEENYEVNGFLRIMYCHTGLLHLRIIVFKDNEKFDLQH